MSTSSEGQSRERKLDTFQNISGMNIEDCIKHLDVYDWKLEEIVADFYSDKGLKKNNNTGHTNGNREIERNTSTSNSVTTFNKPNPQPRVNEMDDRYVAELLQRFGDADEAARKQGTQYEQTHPTQQFREQPQEDFATGTIVHERQQLLRCGIHALNNLFQIRQLFTHEHLDAIVYEFDRRYANNDYGMTWVGDYDLRILIEAITRKGHPVRQINYRNGESLPNLPWDTYFGLLMNINGAHWFTIKRIDGIYYNLDSTFPRPSRIGQKDALANYLIYLIHNFKDIYIFVVSPSMPNS